MGFTASFALKDITSNALSGILLILSRPFKQGDYIAMFASKDLTGEVVDVNLRYTVLNTGDNCIFIPNSIMFTNAVTVRSTGP